MRKTIIFLAICFIVSCKDNSQETNIMRDEVEIATISDAALNESIGSYVQDAYKGSKEEHKSKIKNFTFGLTEDRCPILNVDVHNDETRKNYISLTFDSAYENQYTSRILDILDAYGVKATFFMTGNFMRQNLDQVGEVIKRGHDIANHSYSHPDFRKVSEDERREQVSIPHDLVKENFGVDMELFRFPFGGYNKDAVTTLKDMDYYPIQWTFDSVDWKNESIDAILNKFANGQNLEAGSIILFHNGAKYTPDVLPTILEMVKAKGLKAVRVSDLIYKDDFYIDAWGTQCKKK